MFPRYHLVSELPDMTPRNIVSIWINFPSLITPEIMKSGMIFWIDFPGFAILGEHDIQKSQFKFWKMFPVNHPVSEIPEILIFFKYAS